MSRFSLPRWSWMVFWTLLVVVAVAVVFRLGNQASAGVTLNDPVVWVEDGARGRVLQINGATREVTAAVRIGDNGDALTVLPRGQDAVFFNRTKGELGVIGAVSLAVDNSDVVLEEGQADPSAIRFLADFDVSPDAFVVAPDRVLVVEPGAGQVRSTVRTGDGLGDTAIDGEGRLLAVTPDAARVGVSSDLGLVPFVELPDPIDDSDAPGLARAGDATFVVDAGRRTVNEILPEGQLGATTCVAGSLTGVKIAGNHLSSSVGTQRVLVHDTRAGILSVSIPESSDCLPIQIDSQGEPEEWGEPVAVDGLAYLPHYGSGQIHVVDVIQQTVLDTLRFGIPGQPFELEVFDGAVWANEPQGTFAAVLRADSLTRISKVTTVRFDPTGDGEGEGFSAVAADEEDDERLFGGSQGDFGFGQDAGEQIGGGGDGAESADAEGEPTDGDANQGTAVLDSEIANAPVILETETVPLEDEPPPDELIANFVFSADTVNVGEVVEFTDASTGNPVSWNWDFGDGTGQEGPEAEKVWDTEGVYTVTLFVTNEAEAEASQSFDFTVIAPDLVRVPTADFSFRSATIEVGETLEFVDQSTGDPESLLWSFGDGSTGTGSVVSHSYDTPGQFQVTLTASNEAGPNTTSAQITVIEGVSPPEAIIGPFPGIVEVGQTVTLISESTNSPTAVSWGFDDGDTALGTTVRHSWSTPGEYRIRLSVSNSAGGDETFADIVVNPRVDPPVARFSESSLEVVAGTEVNFTDLSLNNPTRISWEFGDNSTAQGANVSHTWDTAGQYTVTLTVQNEAGTDEAAKTVTVLPPPPDPPSANFTFASATVPVNSIVNFTDTSTGDPTEWLWSFGDGGSSSAQNPPHSFSAPGEYDVRLTATNAGGTDSVTKTIVVVDPPVASFTFASNELVVDFTDTSQNLPTDWTWNFGDGEVVTGVQNPTKTYDAPGVYTVRLTASNSGGTSAPFTAQVLVLRAPDASFAVTTGALTAQFTDTSTDGPTAWLWNFGDGTTTAVQNPTHTYATADTYDVTLTATNAEGSSTTTQQVTVMNAPPVAVISCQVVGAGVACDSAGTTGATTYTWSAPGALSSTGINDPTSAHTYGATGNYTITLTAANAGGTTDSASTTVSVTVPEPPEITNMTVVSNNLGTVEVNAVATNSPTSWTWSAPGASSTSGGTTASPTFTYPASGSYTVTATATNTVGSSAPDSITFTVTIPAPPVVTAVNVTSNSGGTVSLAGTATNSPTSWAWNVAGATITSGGTSSTPTFTVPANGTYSGTVTATNNDGASAPFNVSFTVTDIASPPVITAVNVTSNSGGTVSLAATATNSPTSFTWNVTGATITSGNTSATPTFTVPSNGTYTGTVTATNNDGTSAPFNVSFTVTDIANPPVVTNVTFTESGGQATLTVVATNSPHTGWTWSMPASQEGSSNAQNPVFTFTENRTYNGTVRVSNNDGTSAAFGFSITITTVPPPPPPPPTAGFTWAPTGNANEIAFTNTSTDTDGGASYSYSFGGGSATGGTNDSPVATFPGPGPYTVSLTVTNGDGQNNTFSTTITVP